MKLNETKYIHSMELKPRKEKEFRNHHDLIFNLLLALLSLPINNLENILKLKYTDIET